MQQCSCETEGTGTQQEQKIAKEWRNYAIYICVFLCSYVPVHFYTLTSFCFSLTHPRKKNFQKIFLVTCKKLQEQQEQQEHRVITPSL